jgi:hypothetical protein
MKRRRAALVLLAFAVHAAGAQAPGSPPSLGGAAIASLWELPRLRESVELGLVSSYDPSNANDDGFSGKYSFIRKEGDGLVVADLKGPGVIYRIHTPTPSDEIIEFYFDGESTPRIRLPFRQLFVGDAPPFLAPLSQYGVGGYYTYAPIPYEKSCKVIIRAPRVQFWQLNWARYDASAGIRSYDPADRARNDSLVARMRDVLARAGTDISRDVAAPGARLTRHVVTKIVPSGGRATLFEATTGGRIVGLKLGPASAFAGKDRGAELRVYWDGDAQPAVAGPVGDLFGYAWGLPGVQSLLFGTASDTNYLYFPMPYDRGARIELRLDSAHAPVTARAEVVVAARPRQSNEAKFYAYWRRENPTTPAKTFSYLNTTGRGHVVGVVLQAQGIEHDGTGFFEGDDRAVIDGDTLIRGTGSEDSFNGGWYDVPGRWDRRKSFALSGSFGYSYALARTGGYRLFLGDAYAYRESIDFSVEHGENLTNHVPGDYAAVAFFYSRDRPPITWTSPSRTARLVRDPTRISLSPGWVSPIVAFSIGHATLTKQYQRGVGRWLTLVADTAAPELGDHGVDFGAPIPATGRYRVSVQMMFGPEQGIIQLFDNDQPVGTALDTYAAERKKGELTPLATVRLEEGDNAIRFKVVGKNPRSTRLSLDIMRVVIERVE